MPQAADATKDNPATQHGRFREMATVQTGPIRVDAEKGILHDVLVLGHKSNNKADYPKRAMDEAVRMYDGAASYVGHTRDGSNPDYDRKIGVIRNPYVAADGIRGEFHFPPKHRLAEQLIWDAANAPNTLGLSHDADCDWHFEKGRRVVDKINRVFSVDLVTRPSHGRGMFEDEDGEITDPSLRPIAEYALSATDNIRSILTGDGTPDEKRGRLIEAVAEWKGQLLEGEIGDRIDAENAASRAGKVAQTADNLIDRVLFDYNREYPTIALKKARLLAIIADWEKELTALGATPGVSTLTEEERNMEIKDLTVEMLQKDRPDIVAVLTKTDERSRLTEEAATLKATIEQKDRELAELKVEQSKRLKEEEIAAELAAAKFPTADKIVCSDRFMEQLRTAADKDARAAIINDRLALAASRLQESVVPNSFSDLTPDPPASTEGSRFAKHWK